MVKALICGGRDFNDGWLFLWTMDEVHANMQITMVVHGGARGADTMAGEWADRNNIPVRVYEADWKTHGKSAGPIRNRQMLDEEDPDIIIAFPGGSGTAHMVKISKDAGKPVLEVEADVEEKIRP